MNSTEIGYNCHRNIYGDEVVLGGDEGRFLVDVKFVERPSWLIRIIDRNHESQGGSNEHCASVLELAPSFLASHATAVQRVPVKRIAAERAAAAAAAAVVVVVMGWWSDGSLWWLVVVVVGLWQRGAAAVAAAAAAVVGGAQT
jgi:hypothetical protein